MTAPSVSAGLALGLIDYAARRGADRAALCRTAGVSPSEDASDARVPLDAYRRLMHAAAQMTRDPAFNLHFSEDVSMSEISILGLIMEASSTMAEAFLQMQRYGRLAVEIETEAAGPGFALKPSDGRLFMEDLRAEAEGFPELTESAFVRLVCGPRRFLPQPHILAVHFRHRAPADVREYHRIFQCPVQFDASWNALEVHPEAATWKVARHPRYVFGALTQRADEMLAELSSAASVRGQLEAALLTLLHEGEASADRMAAQLGFSRQTLFRKLRAENTNYADVLESLRQRLAIAYLKAGAVSVNETAYLVGFSDPAAFSRAFKRWTGETPGAFRQAHKAAKFEAE